MGKKMTEVVLPIVSKTLTAVWNQSEDGMGGLMQKEAVRTLT